MKRVLVLSCCLMAFPVYMACAQAPASPVQTAGDRVPENSIFYSGQLDGFAKWAASCHQDCDGLLQRAITIIRDKKKNATGSILIGLGNNFAPDPGPNFQKQVAVYQRKHPGVTTDLFRVIEFLHQANYDAVVPGVQDFYFGAEFVRQSDDEVNMVATNLVRTAMQPSTCPAYPPLPAVTILLPNQISSSIASGSSAGAAGAAGGGSGGGGKGKGGKKGGGAAPSSSGGSAGTAGGAGGSSAGANPGTCLPADGSEVHKNTDPKYPPPKILWPDANSIYPWTTEIGFAQPLPPNSDLYLCKPENAPKPPLTEDPQKACSTKLKPSQAGGSIQRYSIDPSDLGINPDGSLLPDADPANFKLLAGKTGRICYFYKAAPDDLNHSCAAITVQEPMFKYAWRMPTGTNYVIIGALAPDTLSGLSSTDTAWYEDEQGAKVPGEEKQPPKVARHVVANDPTSAILQALHAFDLLNEQRDGVYGVLLAQMPPSEAKALADSLGESSARNGKMNVGTRVGLIFSAADLVEASPHLTVDVGEPRRVQANAGDSYFIPVLTPGPVFQRQDCLSQDKDPASCLSYVSPGKVPDPPSGMVQLENVPPTTDDWRKSPRLIQAWATPFCSDEKLQPTTHLEKAQAWECRLLRHMLEDTAANRSLGNSSDIAVLEEKDFDFLRSSWSEDETPPPNSDQDAEILWKAGRLARVSLLGSTIEALLQQNDKLQAQNFQVLPSSRSLQQLKILGIKKVGQVYYINGMPLSESETYSVATTDRLANATSDYPQLAQVDLENPNLFPLHNETTVQIADIAVSSDTDSAAEKYAPSYAAGDLEGTEPSPEPTRRAPKPSAPSYSYSNRTLPLTTFNTLPSEEQNRQERRLLHVILEQDALSYSSAAPNQSDPSIGTNFGGVSNPNVSAAYSSSVSALQNLRIEWYPNWRRIGFEDMGLDDLFNVAESVQGSLVTTTTTPVTMTTAGGQVPERIKSLTANNITLSPFFEFQAPWWPAWKALVVRAIASENVVHPVPQYLAGCTAGSALTFESDGSTATTTCDSAAAKEDFQFSLQRTWTLGESVGTRLEENDFRYAEFGFTHQRSHEVLSDVGVVNAGAAHNLTYFCSLIGAQSLTFCAGVLPAEAGGSLAPSYSNYSQNGGYILGLWTVPMAKRVVLQGSGFGNFFAYGNKNQSVLTHYAFNAQLTLLANLPANFSIGPTLNEFWFQDNATRTIGSSLTRRTIGAQLNYSFDWHTGVSMKEFYGNSQ